ncbi:MAG: radical SAM protein [Candidatus Omnitrophica bacterium]|nr:radical SAM protein [Candidatus Omnitrophota bacterium]MBU4589419.1 radical SAM protein [Candidatus Omnitrophota bacterium]
MPDKKYKYIYGPVSSWRLGSSLGVDPISGEKKVCTFDCVYCQIGDTKRFSSKREVFVPTGDIIKEIKSLPELNIDYITFSGTGEPALVSNLGEIIKEIRKLRKEKIAIITNSSLIDRKDVQEDLGLADLVMLKLDAHSPELFLKINKPLKGITFDRVLKGIKEFSSGYKGKLALQIMFIEKNRSYAGDIAGLAKDINPDEVQLNTPLRPCSAKPLSKKEMDAIKLYFKGMRVVCVYDARKKKVEFINRDDTSRRRGSHD